MAAPLTPPVRAIAAGGLIGFGVAAWADEIAFYHLLAWNNRVNTSSFELGQVLDNAVHVAGVFTPLYGLVFAAGARRTGGPFWRALLGGSLLGAAFFRLIGVLVEHASTKLLQSHNPAEIALYDHTWTLVAWPMFLAGAVLVLLPGRALAGLRATARPGTSRLRNRPTRPTAPTPPAAPTSPAAPTPLGWLRLGSIGRRLRTAREQFPRRRAATSLEE